MSPQGSSSKGERRGGRNAQRQGRRKLGAPSRADRTEGTLMTCDPVGRPAGEHIFELKRRVETNRDDAAGTDARNRRKGKPSRAKAKSDEHCQQKQPRTFPCIIASHRRGVDPFFVLKPIERAWRSPRKCRSRGVGRVATTKDHKLKKRPRPRPLAHSHYLLLSRRRLNSKIRQVM